jgi:predicted DNA-binding transcriptional regulator AlpA
MEPEPMVDVKRVEELYGNPRSWWYSAAESGRVPSYKVGKYRRFRISEIESWLQSQRNGSTSGPAVR